MALLCGVADPLSFLNRAGTQWDVAVAVVRKAQELRAQEQKALIEAQAALTGNRVGEVVGTMVAKMLRGM